MLPGRLAWAVRWRGAGGTRCAAHSAGPFGPLVCLDWIFDRYLLCTKSLFWALGIYTYTAVSKPDQLKGLLS